MNVTKELDTPDDVEVADVSEDSFKAVISLLDRPKLEALVRPKDTEETYVVPLDDICDTCLRSILFETLEKLDPESSVPIVVRKLLKTR